MPGTVFYAWQSTLDDKWHRHLIKRALEDAVRDLKRDDELADSPRLDHDTRGAAGAVNIVETILRKIDRSDAFVADVSICFHQPNVSVGSPNPNVLFELGYAVARLGWPAIVLVANKVSLPSGSADSLPFDIAQHRLLMYELADDGELAGAKKELARDLSGALKLILTSSPLRRLRAFLEDTNPEVRAMLGAHQQRIHLAVSFSRVPELEQFMASKAVTDVAEIRRTGSVNFVVGDGGRIGDALNDVADGPKQGFEFHLTEAFFAATS